MLRAIFRIITLTLFTIILIVGLAVWKGGEPFRWVGKKTVSIGMAITEFGDAIDELKGKKKRVEKTYKELKEIIKDEEKGGEGYLKKNEEGTDKGRRSE